MKRTTMLVLSVLASSWQAQGQGAFNAGDTIDYHFETLPHLGRFFDVAGRGTDAGVLSIQLVHGTLQAGDDFRVELFETGSATAPFFSVTFNNPGTLLDQRAVYSVPGAWQDLSGSVRLTGLSGSVEFSTIDINARVPVPLETGFYDLYTTALPVPEPGVLSLGLVGWALLGSRLWRRRAQAGRRGASRGTMESSHDI